MASRGEEVEFDGPKGKASPLDLLEGDFEVGEWHGTNAFIRDGERVFRTYFINPRGDEAMGSTWSYLDITGLGRQEEWEDSPEGHPPDGAVQMVELAPRKNFRSTLGESKWWRTPR